MTVVATTALARACFHIVHWSLDSHDSFIADAAALTEHVRYLPVMVGDILLFHEDQPQTLEAPPSILKDLKAHSVGIATVVVLTHIR